MKNVKKLLIAGLILIFLTNVAFAGNPENPEPFGIITDPYCEIADR